MKKKINGLFIIAFVIMTTFVSVSAASASWFTGSNNNLKASYSTNWDAGGDYITVRLEGYGNKKQVYARMGETGGYSDWIASTTFACQRSDWGYFGAIGKGDYNYATYYQ